MSLVGKYRCAPYHVLLITWKKKTLLNSSYSITKRKLKNVNKKSNKTKRKQNNNNELQDKDYLNIP